MSVTVLIMDVAIRPLVLTFMAAISVAVTVATVAMVEPVLVSNKINCIGAAIIKSDRCRYRRMRRADF